MHHKAKLFDFYNICPKGSFEKSQVWQSSVAWVHFDWIANEKEDVVDGHHFSGMFQVNDHIPNVRQRYFQNPKLSCLLSTPFLAYFATPSSTLHNII